MSRIITAVYIFGFSARGMFVFLALAALPGRSEADQVILATGEALEGDVSEIFGDTLVLDHPSLGKVEIPLDDIKDLNIDPDPEGGDTALPGGELEKAGEDAHAPAPPERDARIEVGANGSEGNSETFDTRAALAAEYRDQVARIQLKASYFYASNRSLITKNQYHTELFNEWYVPQTPWLMFLQARYDWKAFGPWRSRETYSAGVGCKIVDRPDLKAALRTGMGFAREYYSKNDQPQPEAMAAGEIKWKISNDQRLEADTTYYYDLEKGGEYRVLSSASWALKVGALDGINVRLEVENEYQSDVDPEFEYNDFKYHASISIDF
jgi:putative salt-induced outer membrane protein YdiY